MRKLFIELSDGQYADIEKAVGAHNAWCREQANKAAAEGNSSLQKAMEMKTTVNQYARVLLVRAIQKDLSDNP